MHRNDTIDQNIAEIIPDQKLMIRVLGTTTLYQMLLHVY